MAERVPTGAAGPAGEPALVRAAREEEMTAIKALVDAHRRELGFVPLPALREALRRGWLYVAEVEGRILGMIDWWARRDAVVVLYNIVVDPQQRSAGVGRQLVATMIAWARERRAGEIQLKCPAELPANDFYRRLGFQLTRREAGRRRPLNCWSLPLREIGDGC